MSDKRTEMEECIRKCIECYRVCTETTMHCLEKGGKHAEQSHIRLMIDCAEMCGTSAHFMVRKSVFHGRTCGVCAEICQTCAEDCQRFPDDPAMKHCAEVCMSCAESCRSMAKA
ncbi:MAG: four-helix bundle copper-binding protein [Syntrophorhabdus sp.]